MKHGLQLLLAAVMSDDDVTIVVLVAFSQTRYTALIVKNVLFTGYFSSFLFLYKILAC
jgi:hypothetical protein